MINAKIIADSKNEFGDRITSMVVRFPRFILAEFNTHRMLSKNSASSRAIPTEKMLEMVMNDPFIPIAYQKEHKGMQGSEYLDARGVETSTSAWLVGRNWAVSQAKYLLDKGVTKQIANRLLEPFMWHTVIVTATEWENFFALRCPQYDLGDGVIHRSRKDGLSYAENEKGLEIFDGIFIKEEDWRKANKGQAEIHMMALAEAMWDAMNESTPNQLEAGEWHIPFGDNFNIKKLRTELFQGHLEDSDIEAIQNAKVKIATARCARVSYLNYEGTDDYDKDIRLFNMLLQSGHMSPFEHCAKTMSQEEYQIYSHTFPVEYNNPIAQKAHLGWSGNFRGFIQLRKTLPNENITCK